MPSIKITGDTSGSLIIKPEAVAGTTTVTFPSITGTPIIADSNGDITVSGTINDATIEDSGWHFVGESGEPAFENSWVNYDTTYGYTRFRKVNNIVYLEGLIKSGTISTSLPCFTLPAGYRPYARTITSTITNNNTIGRLDILTDGKVLPYTGSNVWYSVWCNFVAAN